MVLNIRHQYLILTCTLLLFFLTTNILAQTGVDENGLTYYEFEYTGAAQTFELTKETIIKLEVWGAKGGGTLVGSTGANGGLGGYSSGNLLLSDTDVLHIFTGQQGSVANRREGGWNGGGQGGAGRHGGAHGGGGASDIRLNGIDLSDRIIVAGGGGGKSSDGQSDGSDGHQGGGSGGGQEGSDGSGANGGTGGTQVAGFALGQGGSGLNATNVTLHGSNGGGGGGYYGGFGGQKASNNTSGHGGGGGSGYIGGVNDGSTDAGEREGNGLVRITILFEGSGTETNPFEIKNAGQLNEIRNHLSSHFILTDDIDLGGNDENGSFWNGGIGWEPIGSNADPFIGTLNGGGYDISDLFINRTTSNVGFFGETGAGATITDLYLTNVSVTSNQERVGALAGNLAGSISNISVTGEISGNGRVGGIAGNSTASAEFVTADVTVTTSSERGGGFAGSNSGSIKNSYFKGSVTKTGGGNSRIGGLVGNNFDGTISDNFVAVELNGSGGWRRGLIGDISGGTRSGNLIDITVSNTTSLGGGLSFTTEEMTKMKTFVDRGWDFDETWGFNLQENDGYPFLRFQKNFTHNPPSELAVLSSLSTSVGNLPFDAEQVEYTNIALPSGTESVDITYAAGENGSLSPTSPQTLTLNNGSAELDIIVTSESGTVQRKYSISFAELSSQVTLNAPLNESVDQPVQPALSWGTANLANSYNLEIATNSSFTNSENFNISEGTTYSFTTDLSRNQTYYWRVRGVNNAGNGTWSQVFSFTTIPNAPTQITLESPAAGESNVELAPILNWTGQTLASQYRLQLSTSADFSTLIIDESEITDSNYRPAQLLDRNTTYYWRVHAGGQGGYGPWSQIFSFTTIPNAPEQVFLRAPENLGTDIPLMPEFEWQALSGSTGYELQISTDEGFNTLALNQQGITTAVFLLSNPLQNSTNYFWRVRAVNAGGDGNWSTPRRFTTIPEVPNQISLSTPNNLDINAPLIPTFTWQPTDRAESYQFELSSNPEPNFDEGKIFISDLITETEIILPESLKLDFETKYWWRVRGINSGGNGPWASPFSMSTIPVPSPESVTIELNADGSYTVYWAFEDEELEVQFFDVYMGPNPTELTFWKRMPAEEFEVNPNQNSAAMRVDSNTLQTEFVAVRAVITDQIKSGFSNIVNISELTGSIPQNWSLVSFPLDTEAVELDASVLFSFNSRENYSRETVLSPGHGYWARSQDGETYSSRGAGFTQRTLSLSTGWNLIGGLVSELPTDQIIDSDSVLGSTPVFGWSDGEYVEADTLKPQLGYWIFAESEGEINLQISAQLQQPASLVDVSETTEKNNLTAPLLSTETFQVSGDGVNRTLFLFPDGFDQDPRHWLLPPTGPGSVLDLRTSDGLSAIGSQSQQIELSSSVWPLSLHLSGDEKSDFGWVLSGQLNEDRVQINLLPGQSTLLSEPMDQLRLERVHRDEMIFETELMSGYPNPFNPSVNLRYRLAQAEDVTMQIYDIAGRRVATLVNARQQPGSYTVQFNGSSLASGIYFVRLRSGNTLAVQKISLIK